MSGDSVPARAALRLELEQLRPLPTRRPDADALLEVRASDDRFVRVGDGAGSVPRDGCSKPSALRGRARRRTPS